jgi:hypothetical protein
VQLNDLRYLPFKSGFLALLGGFCLIIIKNEKSPLDKQAFFVDPPGLEPGLCGTKIRRVANYTMGHCVIKRAAKLEIFFKNDH